MRARKAGSNGAQRGGAVKGAHAKPRVGSKPARPAKPAGSAHKEPAVAVKKSATAASVASGPTPSHRPDAGMAAASAPRGNPPPLPAPIASFNF